MNIMQMMKQAQGLQKRLQDTQKELAALEITGEAANGAVKVTCDGQGKFKSIKLTAEAIIRKIRLLLILILLKCLKIL